MQIEHLIILLGIFIGLEVFESNWQKSDTFYGIIAKNFKIYEQSLWLYFLLNPTFIYSIFLAFYLNNFNFWMSTIVVLKFADISFRLHLMQKISNNESIQDIIPIDITMNIFLRYLNVLIYSLCFLFSILS